jgi:hypothetical protein
MSMVAALFTMTLTPAHAVGLQTFHGTVSDAIGRPLQGVAISDGDQVVFTDANGDYSMGEQTLNTYRLTPSKVGMTGTSKVVGPVEAVNPINFTMLYTPGASVTPNAFAPNPPRQVQLALTSYAPTTSCARWVNIATGAVVPLSLTSPVQGGKSTWSAAYSTDNMSDGQFGYRAELYDCPSSTLLGSPVPGTFTADSIGPSLSLLAPRDGSNVLATNQPMIISANDYLRGSGTGSGVKSSSIAVTVHNLTTMETDRHPSASLSGNVIRTQAVSLTQGNRYEVTVSAADNAGNTSSVTSGFQVMSQAFTSPLASIRLDIPSTTATSKTSADALNDTYTWTGIPTTVGPFTASLRDTQHAGDGTIRVTVPTAQARVTYTLAGVPGLAVTPVQASSDVTVSYRVDAVGTVDAAVPQQTATISSHTAVVPKNADAGSVKLFTRGRSPRRHRLPAVPRSHRCRRLFPGPLAEHRSAISCAVRCERCWRYLGPRHQSRRELLRLGCSPDRHDSGERSPRNRNLQGNCRAFDEQPVRYPGHQTGRPHVNACRSRHGRLQPDRRGERLDKRPRCAGE